MDSRKLEFADDMMREVDKLCKIIFNVKSPDNISNILGISHDQMKVVIEKVILGFPEKVFNVTSPKLLQEVKHLCAQEFIFFEVQEINDGPTYQENLQRFITFLSMDILHLIDNYYQQKGMKGEENG